MELRVSLKQFATMFAVQMVNYCICCVSYISLSRGSYAWTFSTDLIYAVNGYFLIKRIVKNEGRMAFFGYTLGGACGSVLAIWLTKHVAALQQH